MFWCSEPRLDILLKSEHTFLGMKEEDIERVQTQVELCLQYLVGGSGHLASYDVVPDSFVIERIEEPRTGIFKYFFKAKAYRVSEFTEYDDSQEETAEVITGSIILDDKFKIVRDERGEVQMEPWKCILPAQTDIALTAYDKAKKSLFEKLTSAQQLIHKIMEERSFEPDNRIKDLMEDLQERLSGSRVTVMQKLEYIELEDLYLNVIVGVIDQDMLTPEDTIQLLIMSMTKRLDNFDEYFEKLTKNELKKPYVQHWE